MRIEHMAIQVQDPAAVAAWYIEHLGFKVRVSLDAEPYTHFLADSSGSTLIELYNNPAVHVPDYAAMDPLLLHLAFVVDDNAKEKARLLAAGATIAEDTKTTPAGDILTMLRDPWGFCIQLCKRKESMLK